MRVGNLNRFMTKHKVERDNLAFESTIALGVATEPPHSRVQAAGTATEVVFFFECSMCPFFCA